MGASQHVVGRRWVECRFVEHGVAQVLVERCDCVRTGGWVVGNAVNAAIVAENAEIGIGGTDGETVLIVVRDRVTLIGRTANRSPRISAIR